jgi:hypothetical protein
MKRDITKPAVDTTEEKLFDDWFDPIETDLGTKVRGFIETTIEEELETALSRPLWAPTWAGGRQHGRAGSGHRHGHRMRSLTGTFGPAQIAVPRPDQGRGWQDERGEERIAAGLSAAHQGRRRLDRRGLPLWDQHAALCAARFRPFSKALWARMWLTGPGAR